MEKPLNILLLEDMPADVELIVRELKKIDSFSFNFKAVDNREAYINGLIEFKPDLILSDHSLFQFDSREALEIFKKHQLNIPFILVTGAVSEEFAVAAIKNGVDDYILKSNLIRLPTAIKNAIHQKQIEKDGALVLQALKESEERYRSLVIASSQIVWSTGPDGMVTQSLPSWQKYTGQTDVEVLGTGWTNAIHPEDMERTLKTWNFSLSNKKKL